MAWPAWKQFEKRVAERLDGYRLGNTGKSTCDVIDGGGWLVVQCKHRQRLPQWLLGALISAEAAAAPDQLPIVVLAEKYMCTDDCLVILRLDQFLQLWR